MTINQILIPLDGSPLAESVLPYAKQFAAGMKWDVELLHVVAPPAPAAPREERAAEAARQAAESYLQRVAASFADTGCRITVRVAQGLSREELPTPRDQETRASVEIVQIAASHPGTLTAMSTHGLAGVSRWLMGSVANGVLHHSAGPLLLIHPKPRSPVGAEPTLRTVVVALDGAPIAEEVLPHVAVLAKGLALKVLLIRAAPSVGERSPFCGSGPADPPDLSSSTQEGATAAQEYLNGIAARLKSEGVAGVETRVADGDAAGAIIDAANEGGDSFVAMTTRSRAGLARMVLGSVADRVTRHAGVPVWLVRPT